MLQGESPIVVGALSGAALGVGSLAGGGVGGVGGGGGGGGEYPVAGVGVGAGAFGIGMGMGMGMGGGSFGTKSSAKEYVMLFQALTVLVVLVSGRFLTCSPALS